jgi:hypothetical protein
MPDGQSAVSRVFADRAPKCDKRPTDVSTKVDEKSQKVVDRSAKFESDDKKPIVGIPASSQLVRNMDETFKKDRKENVENGEKEEKIEKPKKVFITPSSYALCLLMIGWYKNL